MATILIGLYCEKMDLRAYNVQSMLTIKGWDWHYAYIWKCRLFMSSAEYSCKLLKAIFCIPANSVDPDQTAPKGVHTVCKKWLLKSQADDNCCDWRFKG